MAPSSGEPNIQIQIYMSIDRHLDAGDMSLDIKPDTQQMITLREGISSSQTLILSGTNLNLEMDKHPQRRYYCGQIYLIAEVKIKTPIDPNVENNANATSVYVLCKGNTLGFAKFQLNPDLPQQIIYSAVNTTFTFTVNIMNWGSEPLPASIDGRPNINMKTYMSSNRELELGYDAEVTMVTPNARMIGQLKEQIPGMKKILLYGKVMGVLPEAVCMSPYLFLVINGGSRAMDVIPEDNVRYIDLSEKIRCNINYVDFSVKSFSLPGGSTLSPRTSFAYQLAAKIELNGDRSVGNTSKPLFRFQFYISRNMIPDDSDLSLRYGGEEQEATLTRVFRETEVVSLNSGTEKLHLPAGIDPWLCGNVYVLAVVDSLDWYTELSEYNNIFAHEVTVKCLHGMFRSW